jgi:hypothetical protein
LSGLWSMVVRRWRHSTSLSLTSSSIARPFHAHGLSPNPRTACRYRYRSICLLFVRCSCAQSPCSSRATPSTSTVAELFPLRRTRLDSTRTSQVRRYSPLTALHLAPSRPEHPQRHITPARHTTATRGLDEPSSNLFPAEHHVKSVAPDTTQLIGRSSHIAVEPHTTPV